MYSCKIEKILQILETSNLRMLKMTEANKKYIVVYYKARSIRSLFCVIIVFFFFEKEKF